MGKRLETTIKSFSGGITSNKREATKTQAHVISNFDVYRSNTLIPNRSTESGDSSASTSKKQAFEVALWTPDSSYKQFALGVQSGTGLAEIQYKALTTGASNDLDDATWTSPAGNQSSTGATSFNLFVYYAKTGKIYGARAGSHIWAFTPDGSTAWADSHQALTYTHIAQGIVHSKDDILYVPYDNKIASNDNGSWNVTVLTLPTYLKVNSICEHGNYLAIGAAPVSGIGNSWVYLWDRDSTLVTLSETVNWGDGQLCVLEDINGILVGISDKGGNTVNYNSELIFRYLSGSEAIIYDRLRSTSSITLGLQKKKVNDRVYFLASPTIDGVLRQGVWSFGKSLQAEGLVYNHDLTPNNDTAVDVLNGLHIVGDYFFVSHVTSGTYAISKTNSSSTAFSAKSVWERIFVTENSAVTKNLVGISVMFEPLPSAGQVILQIKKDAESSWTTVFTENTDDAITHSSINIESTGADFGNYKELYVRIESTGGAEITGFRMIEELIDDNKY